MFWVATGLGLPSSVRAADGPFILAGGGRSFCAIVVNHGSYASAEEASAASGQMDWFDADASGPTACTESFAATELRHYLCAMTGLDPTDPSHFPIRDDREEVAGNVIIVGSGRSNHQCAPYQAELQAAGPGSPAPGPEGFRIKTVRKKDGVAILISGFDRVGTLYGAYDFLEMFGVRWFSPGLAGEVVPARSELSIAAIDRSDAPKFSTRGYWAEFFVPEHEYVVPQGRKGTIEFFNWMARNRMNLWSAGEEAVPAGEMKKRGLHLSAGGHTFYLLLDPSAPYPYRHSGFPAGDGKPADPYPESPEFKGNLNGDGVLSYSEAHPEWYGLGADGKRHFPVDPFGENFCTSNPHMMAEFLKNLVEKLELGAWKYADVLDWCPEDSSPDHWCQCDNCRKLGSPTDRNILMAHLIRQELQRALAEGRLKREIKVTFILYQAAGLMDPPTRPLPAGFDYTGVTATFYPIHRCYVHALDDPACTEFNRPYADDLKAWRENPFYKGTFQVGEYYNISAFRDLPILYTRVMEHDIRYFHENGARGMHYMHVAMGNWGPRAVTNDQFARMLWNPDVDVRAFLDEYFRLRYENARIQMRDFYASLEQAMQNVPAYVSTPASYNIPAHLNYRGSGPRPGHLERALHDIADGKPTTLFPFLHLRMAGDHPPPDDGPSMEDTVHELERTERLMDEALSLKVSDRVRACILEDEGLFRYGAATVRLYYHLARSTGHPLRSPEWTQEMKLASYQAEYLDSHPVGFAAHNGGTMGMMRNALEATGVKDVYLKWKALMP